MNSFYLLAFGMPFTLAIFTAVTLCSVCWLLESVIGRGIGLYAGHLAIVLVLFCIARIVYADITQCSGAFGREILLAHCEWSPVLRVLVAFLIIVTVPILALSEIMLRRWSRNRALPRP
jgi:hypothetical protein